MSQQKDRFVTRVLHGPGSIRSEAPPQHGDKVVATVFGSLGAGHRHFGRLVMILNNARRAYFGTLDELDLDAIPPVHVLCGIRQLGGGRSPQPVLRAGIVALEAGGVL